jgi:hypothetical protein
LSACAADAIAGASRRATALSSAAICFGVSARNTSITSRSRGEVPPEVRRSMELWVGCIAGALGEQEYIDKLRAAGFTEVDVELWRVYQVDDARAFLAESGIDPDGIARDVAGRFASAFIRARKPAITGCCTPGCCQ